jgi:ribonuclease P protein component
MLSKKQRLNTSQFDEVFNFGKNKRTSLFSVKYKENNQSFPRFAVVIPKKQIKIAVMRNYFKRRFMNLLKESNLIDTKKDYVFVLNKNIKTIKKDEILLTINDLRLE